MKITFELDALKNSAILSKRKPFDLIAEGLSRPNWLPQLDKLRNWLMDAVEIQRGLVELKAMESTAYPGRPGDAVRQNAPE